MYGDENVIGQRLNQQHWLVKVKLFLCTSWSGGTAPPTLNPRTRWKWAVIFTTRPLYELQQLLNMRLGGLLRRSGHCRELNDTSAVQSPYRLSYRGSHYVLNTCTWQQTLPVTTHRHGARSFCEFSWDGQEIPSFLWKPKVNNYRSILSMSVQYIQYVRLLPTNCTRAVTETCFDYWE